MLVGQRLSAESAIFAYDDFGPPSAVYDMIGHPWYQWDTHGDSSPHTKYDIKVVVYWNETMQGVKKRYPVEPLRKKDYRYITYDLAKRGLTRVISEFEEAGFNADNLHETLRRINKLKSTDRPIRAFRKTTR